MLKTAAILLVDDDPQVRLALGEVLRDERYEVVLAADGEEAVHHLQADPARAFQAVLLDLAAGDEEGWHVFQRLMGVDPHLPVIALTSTRYQSVPAYARQCVAVLAKPLDLFLLCEIVHSVTSRHARSMHIAPPRAPLETTSPAIE